MNNKRKMAFIDLTNYKDWPMGGMLEYELAILKHLVNEYEVEIWGVSVDGKVNPFLNINGKEYPIHIYADAKTVKKIVPNYWRGLRLSKQKKVFPKDYDIVYAHTGSCLIPVSHMVDKSKTKLVYHQHGLNHRADFSLMSLIQRPGLSMAQKIADLVFVVSDPESVKSYAEEMSNKTKAKFISIGSPINLGRFDEKKSKEKINARSKDPTSHFLYTGRLSAFKDVKTLINAMKRYTDEVNSKAVLEVAGSGAEFDNLKKQISDLKLESNVKLLGPVSHDDIYQLLQEADVFLTASGGEGVSVSVLEAYASGLPVVCFKVPGLEKQIIDNITGVFAKERNADSFYEAMVHLDGIRTETAYRCLEEAKKYDSVQIADVSYRR